MDTIDLKKAKAHDTTNIIEYVSHSIVSKNIICKNTGIISIVAIDTGEELKRKISPFDNFIQVIDGKAEIEIDEKFNSLETGQSIIIPAHSRNIVRSKTRFKILSTIIKSGYEELA